MTIQEINRSIENAAKKLLELDGNTKTRDDLLRSLGNLILLERAMKDKKLSTVLEILIELGLN